MGGCFKDSDELFSLRPSHERHQQKKVKAAQEQCQLIGSTDNEKQCTRIMLTSSIFQSEFLNLEFFSLQEANNTFLSEGLCLGNLSVVPSNFVLPHCPKMRAKDISREILTLQPRILFFKEYHGGKNCSSMNYACFRKRERSVSK